MAHPLSSQHGVLQLQDLRLGSALQVWHCVRQHESLVGQQLPDICLQSSAQSAVLQRLTEVQLYSAVCLTARRAADASHVQDDTGQGSLAPVICPALIRLCPLQVYGRELFLCDCDNFTHEWYQEQLGVNMHALRVMIGCTAVCRAAPTGNPPCWLASRVCVPQCLAPGQHAHACSAGMMSTSPNSVPVSCWLQVASVEGPLQEHVDPPGELPVAAEPQQPACLRLWCAMHWRRLLASIC